MTQADIFGGLGAFCCRHRRIVVIVWVALVVVGGGLGSSVFGRLSDHTGASSSESEHAFNMLDEHRTVGQSVIGIVRAPVDDPGVRAAVERAASELQPLRFVAQVRDAYSPGGASLRARDGNAGLVVVSLPSGLDDSDNHRLTKIVRERLKTINVGRVTVGGDALLNDEFRTAAQTDAERGEAFAFPVALVVLVIVFGGVAAASLPLIAALVAVAGSLLLLLLASLVMDVAVFAVNIITLYGLGLAIDYTLLTVYRFREERSHGRAVPDAVHATTATAGRTVAFSAMTVLASLAGLLVFSDTLFRSLAIGGIGVTLVAVLAALTLTPALLGFWGHRIKPARMHTDTGRFSRLARWVHRRPVPVVIVVGLGLLACGLPFLHANYRNGGPTALARGSEVRSVADELAIGFPGQKIQPVLVLALAPRTHPSLTTYADQLRARPDVASVSFENGLRGDLTVLDVVPKGNDSQGPIAQRLVKNLRAARPPGVTSFVTGSAAYLVDFRHGIAVGLPWALLLVAIATVFLLFLMTGSVVIPIKALLMNFLSLGATFGVLVWVFQDGHFARFIGGERTGGLETVVPVLVFVFAFGLSMDYEVFLIARVRELVDEGVPNDTAVERALQRSGRIITSAALLIVIVFVGFATAQEMTVKEIGVALATAVIVDVTLVRCLLVPATMTLLGDRNWWAPAWLRRLHGRVGIREHNGVAPAPVVD
ncbi:MAG: MMPL family transporter [Actinomycetes bacterium]